MKRLIPLLLIALLSCKKDDLAVVYDATCDVCFVEYQASDDRLASVLVEGTWNVFPVDTVVVDGEDVVIKDSTRILGSWSYSVDLEHNTAALLRLRNVESSTVSTASVRYGATVRTATLRGRNEQQWVH